MTNPDSSPRPTSTSGEPPAVSQAEPPAAVIRACFELITYAANGGPATLVIDKAMAVDQSKRDLGSWTVTVERS